MQAWGRQPHLQRAQREGGRWQGSSEKGGQGGQGGRRYRAQLLRSEQRPMQKHTECMQQDSTPSSQHIVMQKTAAVKQSSAHTSRRPYPTFAAPAVLECRSAGSTSWWLCALDIRNDRGVGCSGVRAGAGAPHPLPTGRRQPAPLGRGGGVRLGAVNRAPCGSAAGRHATSEARAPRPLAAWHAWLFALCLCGSETGRGAAQQGTLMPPAATAQPHGTRAGTPPHT